MALSLATVGGKITAAFINAIVTRVNRQGLTVIIPTSVAGTGVTLGATGTVTFTAATTVSVNGCFTSEFDNYHLIGNITSKSSAANATLALRLAGTNATTNYSAQRTYSNAAAVTTARITGSNWELEAGTLSTSDIDAKLFGPALTAETRLNSLAVGSTSASIYTSTLGGHHNTGAAYDGMTLGLSSAGNMTGTFRIYGFNN